MLEWEFMLANMRQKRGPYSPPGRHIPGVEENYRPQLRALSRLTLAREARWAEEDVGAAIAAALEVAINAVKAAVVELDAATRLLDTAITDGRDLAEAEAQLVAARMKLDSEGVALDVARDDAKKHLLSLNKI